MQGNGNVAEQRCVRDLLAQARSLGLARLDAELLLASLLRIERAQLLAFDERTVDPLTMAMYLAACERRAAGEPLAYITGVKEFWSLPVNVAQGVLIPRPETELLVELCLARQPGAAVVRVADLGTGSGAIALALARERPHWQIVATDQSAEAIDIAARNCRRLGIENVTLRRGDWCAALDGRFDAIVSNPPYIAPDHPALRDLCHEPVSALVAPDAGYADLLAIAGCARGHLVPGGLLLLEHGSDQAARLASALASFGYRDITSHRDAAGLERVAAAIWP